MSNVTWINKTKHWKDDSVYYAKSYPTAGYRFIREGVKEIPVNPCDEFPEYKTVEVGHLEEDPTLIVAESFESIPKDCCRVCGKKITLYKKEYERHDFMGGMHSVMIYAYDNNYCEECAREKAKKTYIDGINTAREVTYGSFVKKGWHDTTYIRSAGSDICVDPIYDPDCEKVETMPEPVVHF